MTNGIRFFNHEGEKNVVKSPQKLIDRVKEKFLIYVHNQKLKRNL